MKVDIFTRLLDKINITDTCWIWTGAKTDQDYGNVYYSGKAMPAHIALWKALGYCIPPKYELDHLCRNRSCVAPDHLEPVTHGENHRRAIAATRPLCPQGHEFSGNNLIWEGTFRRCRECKNARARKALVEYRQQLAEEKLAK